MVRRFAAASALMVAALTFAPTARAQGFFSMFETSPRDVLNQLEDEGYSPRLPMIRRGGVYIVEARTSSGRSVRLVVDVHDGRVLERYAAAPSYRDDGDYYDRRAPRRFSDEYPDEDQSRPARRVHDESAPMPVDRPRQEALGDPFAPSPRSDDSALHARPEPSPSPTVDKAKARLLKKRHDALAAKEAPDATVAPDFASKPSPDAAATKPDVRSATPKPEIAAKPTPEAVQARTEPKPVPPKPEMTTPPSPEASQAKSEPKLPTPKPDVAPKPSPTSVQVKTEPKPMKPTPEPVQAHAEAKAVEPPPKPEPAPKPETPRKKLNDLPVGTLD